MNSQESFKLNFVCEETNSKIENEKYLEKTLQFPNQFCFSIIQNNDDQDKNPFQETLDPYIKDHISKKNLDENLTFFQITNSIYKPISTSLCTKQNIDDKSINTISKENLQNQKKSSNFQRAISCSPGSENENLNKFSKKVTIDQANLFYEKEIKIKKIRENLLYNLRVCKNQQEIKADGKHFQKQHFLSRRKSEILFSRLYKEAMQRNRNKEKLKMAKKSRDQKLISELFIPVTHLERTSISNQSKQNVFKRLLDDIKERQIITEIRNKVCSNLKYPEMISKEKKNIDKTKINSYKNINVSESAEKYLPNISIRKTSPSSQIKSINDEAISYRIDTHEYFSNKSYENISLSKGSTVK